MWTHNYGLRVYGRSSLEVLTPELGESQPVLPDVAADVVTLTLCHFRQTTFRQLLEPKPKLWHSHLKQLNTKM